MKRLADKLQNTLDTITDKCRGINAYVHEGDNDSSVRMTVTLHACKKVKAIVTPNGEYGSLEVEGRDRNMGDLYSDDPDFWHDLSLAAARIERNLRNEKQIVEVR